MIIKLDEEKINIIINYKNIKHTYFKFDEANNLVVSSSFYMKEKDIIKYIKDNKEKILKMYKEKIKKNIENELFYYLGEKYEIQIHPSLTKVGFKENVVYTKDLNMLDAFWRKECMNVFTSEAKICEKVFAKIPEYSIKIRDMKTRWGVCNTKTNTITLNTKLLRYPLDVIDYVIIHEMCHFFVKSHSKEFWSLVKSAVPNYKEIKRKLK